MGLADFFCTCVTGDPISSGSSAPDGGFGIVAMWGSLDGPVGLAPSQYFGALQQLLPPGKAWTRDADANLTQLLEALSFEPGRIGCAASQMLSEADPATAVELLPDWLRVLGLDADASLTTAQQQQAIVAWLTAQGGASIPFIEAVAEQLGYSVTVTEYFDEFIANSPCNAALYEPPSNWVWLVTTASAGVMDSVLANVLHRLAPSHTFLLIDFT